MASTGILADSWMTGIGPYGTSLNWEDCSALLAACIVEDYNTLGQIKKGEAVTDVIYTWVNDSLNPITFTGYMATSGSLVISSPTNTAAIDRLLQTNMVFGVLRPTADLQASWTPTFYDGLFAVQTESTSTLTCVAYGNTPFMTTTAGTVYVVYGRPKADNATVSPDISRPRSLSKNYTQVFERGIETQKTREGLDMKAVPDELKLQMKRRTQEIKRELNKWVIGGIARQDAAAAGSFTGDSQIRTMAGLYWLMRDPNLDGTNEDAMMFNASAKEVDGNRLNDLLYEIENAGGIDDQWDPVILCNPVQARKISRIGEEWIRKSEEDRTTGHYVDTFLSDLGRKVPIVWDRYWRYDLLMVADRSRISLHPYTKDDLSIGEVAADSNRFRRWQMSMQYTLKLECPDTSHAMYYNLKWW
uniref:Putative structural protein n=1 Tax=viral metagenome TaxID=1070528 RepID=A0A6H1ZIA8_9ZZZZ